MGIDRTLNREPVLMLASDVDFGDFHLPFVFDRELIEIGAIMRHGPHQLPRSRRS
jgi:hypothetical protein